jgi:hypothetical protein
MAYDIAAPRVSRWCPIREIFRYASPWGPARRAIASTDETFRVRFDALRCSSVAEGYGLRTFGGDNEADKPESRWRASLGLGVA